MWKEGMMLYRLYRPNLISEFKNDPQAFKYVVYIYKRDKQKVILSPGGHRRSYRANMHWSLVILSRVKGGAMWGRSKVTVNNFDTRYCHF